MGQVMYSHLYNPFCACYTSLIPAVDHTHVVVSIDRRTIHEDLYLLRLLYKVEITVLVCASAQAVYGGGILSKWEVGIYAKGSAYHNPCKCSYGKFTSNLLNLRTLSYITSHVNFGYKTCIVPTVSTMYV